ncbi:YtxH domain-containing protein [Ornithinimicrobium pratense]|uniref:YtxH domain-containing protein n=1 Tax=Ornithinimicrobium pratense TaxID=2593973 RepID=A0A5J6V942_9MICO|nr:YtxH domain-containing protein [Ornithinimicrobium pratense]QFG69651.1 YtxH domain-containing protein [Ornithinimicrobium pratense]
MRNKLMLLIAGGAGYVLGARAGRERYDEIADRANKLWTDPRVQEKVEEVKAKAPEVAQKVGDQAKSKADDLRSKAGGNGSNDMGGGSGGASDSSGGGYGNATGEVTGDGEIKVDDSGFGPGGDRLP